MILICGIPNAGKTTFSKHYKNVIHWDELHSRSEQRRKDIEDIVKNSKDNICIEGMYNHPNTRKSLVEASNQFNICIWIDTPEEVCLQREYNFRNRPAGLVLHHAKVFQPPTYEEGWDRILVVRDNKVSFINKE